MAVVGDLFRRLARGRAVREVREVRDVERVPLNEQPYLTESVHTVVLQKSFPAQIRQIVLYMSNNEG